MARIRKSYIKTSAGRLYRATSGIPTGNGTGNGGVSLAPEWAGKSVFCIGDSITDDFGISASDAYRVTIKNLLGLSSITAKGYSGKGAAAPQTGTDDSIASHVNDTGLAAWPTNVDAYIVYLGTNDFKLDHPIGAIDDTDIKTFYGGLNKIVQGLQAKAPGKLIGLASPLQRSKDGYNITFRNLAPANAAGSNGHLLIDYVEAMEAIASKYGIYFLDMYHNIINSNNLPTLTQDLLHPNAAGHKLIGRVMAGWLSGWDLSAQVAPKPTKVGSLASPSKTSTTINLTWGTSTSTAGAIVAYEIWRSPSGANTFVKASERTASPFTSYTNTGLSANTAYDYYIIARDAGGYRSDPSNILTVTTSAAADTAAPDAPTGLASSSITSSGFTVTWTAPNPNGGTIQNYDVLLDGVLYSTVTTNSASVTGRAGATTYQVTVQARDDSGNVSLASAALPVLTTSGGPTVYGESQFNVNGAPATLEVTGQTWENATEWNKNNGKLVHTASTNNYMVADFDHLDGTLEADITLGTARKAGLVGRFIDPLNYIIVRTDVTTAGEDIILYVREAGTSVKKATGTRAAGAWVAGNSLNLKVVMVGANIKVLLDNVQIIDYTLDAGATTTKFTAATGASKSTRYGVYSSQDTGSTWDFIKFYG